MTPKYDSPQKGFTLLEVMIVVIIIGILAMIAIPSYQRYVTKARLEEGKSVLSQNYLWLDNLYNKNNGYIKERGTPTSVITKADLPFQNTGSNDPNKSGYTYTVTQNCGSPAPEETTATSFCLKAEPKGGQRTAAGGGVECGTLMVDQSGKYRISTNANSTINDGVTCF